MVNNEVNSFDDLSLEEIVEWEQFLDNSLTDPDDYEYAVPDTDQYVELNFND